MQRGERPPGSPPASILWHIIRLTTHTLPYNVGTAKDAAA